MGWWGLEFSDIVFENTMQWCFFFNLASKTGTKKVNKSDSEYRPGVYASKVRSEVKMLTQWSNSVEQESLCSFFLFHFIIDTFRGH